ncbi:MAG: LysM peptidoglycan-binding domain-containing protein [Clostridiales bacterium]|nr:LysM peptidoglycan-binding domain-containing protein [Clostridiales bacterium]
MLTHIVKKGETLWLIAKARRLSLDALIAANPQIEDPNMIIPGMRINIPEEPPPKPEEREFEEECLHPPRPFIYMTEPGDTAESVARRFSLTLEQLMQCNRQLVRGIPLKIGQKIFIPGLTPALDAHMSSFCPYERQAEKPEKEAPEKEFYGMEEPLPEAFPVHHKMPKETRGFLLCSHCGKPIYYY